MNTMYLVMIIFLFALAVIDLWVGVSNDAVNFLNSAVGSKAAKFKTIMIVAALGIFIGAAISNGMMDIARHGIFQPAAFSMKELMCIFMAVMLTDVLLLDLFNSMGMPTSTTVSLVFELLGGTFCLSCMKIASDATGTLAFSDLLNTSKALEVILGIFLSVGIAFVVGTLVQWLTRLLFTFNYTPRLKWFVGLFGGVSISAILYFVFIKVVAKSPLVPQDITMWIEGHTAVLLCGMFVVSCVLMEVLYLLRVNVFKIIVLFGTFALAMAFASNDLVNFVGVPLAALSTYTDFAAHGTDPESYMMGALNAPASTPMYFLVAAGLIMVLALVKSSKAQKVVQTSVNLSRQAEGDEMFGGSRVAKSIVRSAQHLSSAVENVLPRRVVKWIDSRFNTQEAIMKDGAAFDLIRASVNLVLGGLLIIMGTSLKLPLSTTYITFIVAMGTSLADRAWTRESAVYRITGVLSVIGGWFMTAAIAFVAAGVVCLLCYWGGVVVIGLLVVAVMFALWHGLHKEAKPDEQQTALDECYQALVAAKTPAEKWEQLRRLHTMGTAYILGRAEKMYAQTCDEICGEDLHGLRKTCKQLKDMQLYKRKLRSRELVGLRSIDPTLALEKNTWFHLDSNAGEQMLYGLRRIAVPCCDHLDNGFSPLPEDLADELRMVSAQTVGYFEKALQTYRGTEAEVKALTAEIEVYKNQLSALRKKHLDRLTTMTAADAATLPQQTAWLYLNILQESQQLLSELRHYLRAYNHFCC